jgi:hypothetical protein
VPLIFIGTQQQEEQDRKAARLKEMEARRQAVLQKKVEGKAKADEDGKKVKEDAERRKKVHEENTSKRPLIRTDSKVSLELSIGKQR